MKNKPVIFIVGSTASGKTATAISLAHKINAEVICADSQTVRKDLNIGTAKPSKQEQDGIKHHLLDLIEPYESYSVARYKKDAEEAIKDIIIRNKVPIIVGGTGLYIDALFFNYTFKESNIDRKKYENLTVKELQDIIIRRGYLMPRNTENPRHLIGVIARGNNNPEDNKPINNALIYGIKLDDEVLKKRINDRVEKMFEDGFIDEVKSLVKMYGTIPEKLDAIGYPIVQRYLDGQINLSEAKQLFKNADWQYARRQKAWFKRNKYIQWFTDSNELVITVLKELESH